MGAGGVIPFHFEEIGSRWSGVHRSRPVQTQAPRRAEDPLRGRIALLERYLGLAKHLRGASTAQVVWDLDEQRFVGLDGVDPGVVGLEEGAKAGGAFGSGEAAQLL